MLSLETHGKRYVNPYMSEITDWLARNGYEPWFVDKSDTVYVRRGVFPVTGREHLRRRWAEAGLAWGRFRRRLLPHRRPAARP